ncbi:MAG: 3-phosphoserine/phosphohydroxythreonine transaminase [Clostridiales Family XIII bacterium]|jgi:phosphoserine aminotransferase|nr:3-phosphoserine/phosphohydroxythreonine transaminase [Clostridiales Family XIII bacterium]
MKTLYNFSAGPSVLPAEALKKAQESLSDYGGSGMSVMEMSHRSKEFDEIIKNTEALFRSVLAIPDNYSVLFLQGGATLQFAMVPMNLLARSGKADYVITGNFANNAYKEALLFGKDISVAWTGKSENFSRIPEQGELTLDPAADYVHICVNNTIFGTKWQYVPETGNVPIVADMSSCILSEPVDVSKYGLIYAGAQKNIAPAGLTLVIIRNDLLGDPLPGTPTMLNYRTMAENGSMKNTPPCWPIYISMLVLEWIRDMGGLEVMRNRNEEKARVLYDYLDKTDFYRTDVNPRDRSIMNVTFKTANEDLDAKFIAESKAQGMSNLKGHRSVGGMRASVYNAMPVEGVAYLVEFMKKFEKENGGRV